MYIEDVCPYCHSTAKVLQRNSIIEAKNRKTVVWANETYCQSCYAVKMTGLNWEGSTVEEQKCGWRHR